MGEINEKHAVQNVSGWVSLNWALVFLLQSPLATGVDVYDTLISVWRHMHASHVVKTPQKPGCNQVNRVIEQHLPLESEDQHSPTLAADSSFSLKSPKHWDDWWAEHMQSNCLSQASSRTSQKSVSHVPLLCLQLPTLHQASTVKIAMHLFPLWSTPKSTTLGLNAEICGAELRSVGYFFFFCFACEISLSNLGIFILFRDSSMLLNVGVLTFDFTHLIET